MDAVILSGGLGTRLRPLTYTRPKPLLPVANQPMLEHMLDGLPEQVDRALLAAGYQVDKLRAWSEETDHRVELVVVEEDEPLGTGGAIKNLEDELGGPFVCLNGDVLSTAPVERMIEHRREADAMGAIALWQVDEPQHYGVVERDGDEIARFVEKPDPAQAPSNLINAGSYVFDLELLDHIGPGRVSLEHEVFPAVLDHGHTLLGEPFEGHWIDCGRPDVYLDAHELLIDGEAELAPQARMDGEWSRWASLGRGAAVEAGARVERAVLFDEARVRSGASVQSSILGEAATVGKDARLDGCVVADGEHVEAGAEHEDQALGVDPQRPVGGA